MTCFGSSVPGGVGTHGLREVGQQYSSKRSQGEHGTGSPSLSQCLKIFLSSSLFSYSEIQCHLLFYLYSITLIQVSSSFTWVNYDTGILAFQPTFSYPKELKYFLKYKSGCVSNSVQTPTSWHAHTHILSSSVAPLTLIVHRVPIGVFLHLLLY